MGRGRPTWDRKRGRARCGTPQWCHDDDGRMGNESTCRHGVDVETRDEKKRWKTQERREKSREDSKNEIKTN